MVSEILNSFSAIKLSRSEQIAIEHFEKRPEGRGFYAVAELLAKYERVDEAIQILTEGLQSHPHYSVARVYLAYLLAGQYFFREAWAILEDSPSSLRGNLSAQILRLKLSVILKFETLARSLARELSSQDFQDADARVIIENIELKSFVQLRRDFAAHLKWTDLDPLTESIHLPQAAREELALAPSNGLKREAEYLQADFQERVARGFFSSPVHEIFLKQSPGSGLDLTSLDELSTARLLRRQGLFQKAFEIYEKLVYSSPGNELLRRELGEMKELRDAQRQIDQKLDPALAEAMDRVRLIDRRIHVLNQLLGRLDEYESAS